MDLNWGLISAEMIVIRFYVFALDRRLLMAGLLLFWRLNQRSAAMLETGNQHHFSQSFEVGGTFLPGKGWEVVKTQEIPQHALFLYQGRGCTPLQTVVVMDALQGLHSVALNALSAPG